jgi:hypothetical protein
MLSSPFVFSRLFTEIYRRPFMALARMILKPKEYVSSSERKKPDLPMTTWDVLFREEEGEMDEAQKRIELILKTAGISQDVMESEVLGGGERWMALGEDNLSSSFFLTHDQEKTRNEDS